MADNGRSLAGRACAPDGVEPAAPSQAKPLVPIAGTCDVCRKNEAIGVASSCLGAVSWAYCRTCLESHAEPEVMFAYTYECCGNDVADWVREITTFRHDQYVSWDDYVQGMAAPEGGETGTGSTVGNSPVPQECAQPHSENNHD